MEAKFYLRKSKKGFSICFEFRNGPDVRFRSSAKQSIRKRTDWDAKNGKVKIPSSTLNALVINTKLTELMSNFWKEVYMYDPKDVDVEIAQKIFDTAIENQYLKPATKIQKDTTAKTVLDFDDEEDNKKVDLFTYYDWFKLFYSTNISPYSKKTLGAGTIKTFNSAIAALKDYAKSRKIATLYFEDIDRKFYYDFMAFLTNKNYSKNYIGTIIQKLKTIMGYAFDEDKHTNLEFKKNYFSKVSEIVGHPYLNLIELETLQNLNLEDEKLRNARDIFLIGSHTGLRIGDLLNFIKKPEYVIEKESVYFKFTQTKTSVPVIVPLNSAVKNILATRNNQLPSLMREGEINAMIKSICKRAKIDSLFTYVRTEGGKEVTYTLPKYKFICTHTARRSFCTNAYKSGMNVHDIMSISGHKTEKIFLNYVKVEMEENAKRIGKHSFFQ